MISEKRPHLHAIGINCWYCLFDVARAITVCAMVYDVFDVLLNKSFSVCFKPQKFSELFG